MWARLSNTNSEVHNNQFQFEGENRQNCLTAVFKYLWDVPKPRGGPLIQRPVLLVKSQTSQGDKP